MQWSLRSWFFFVTIACIWPIFWWLVDTKYFALLLLPFSVILLVAISIAVRDFGRDSSQDPPNLS